MATPQTPFNIRIMELSPQRLSRVPRIQSTSTYDGTNMNFDDQGLFSRLFGEVGSETRDYTFGRIELNTRIIHPFLCARLKKLKRLYEDIWMGRKMAIFDEKEGDFIEADFDGQTGYHFFVSHIPKLKFKRNKSIRRSIAVDVVEKNMDRLFMDQYLVLPAGLRDIQVDERGRTTEDEVNEYYRKLIRLSNSLEGSPKNQGPELDNVRMEMQKTANEIYAYFTTLLEGKSGFLLGRYGSRNVQNGTRNVITSMSTSSAELDGLGSLTIDDVLVPLYQLLNGVLPLLPHYLRTFPLYQLSFPQTDNQAYLVNPATLKRVEVPVRDYDIDFFTTVEGNAKIVNRFSKLEFRNKPIIIKGHYLGLIYSDTEKYQILSDINELPEGWDKNKVRPIRYGELLYLIGYKDYNNKKIQVTRYPVTGDESIYLGDVYAKTTASSFHLREYINGEPTDNIALEFPNPETDQWISGMSVHPSRLAGLGGDFDGDTCSGTIIMSQEAIDETNRINNLVSAILKPGGGLQFNIENDIVVHTCYSFTRPETIGRRSTRKRES